LISQGWRPAESDERLLRAAFRGSPPPAPDELDSAPVELLPLIYRAVAAADADSPALGRLKGVYRRTWYGNQLLMARAGDAAETLRAAGIDALVVGGAAIGLLHYGEVGVRPMSDTRIAVRPAELADAAAALARTAWHEPPVAGLDDERWSARVPLALGEQVAHAACATDELVRTCAHGVAWSRRSQSWRWVADALAILGPDGEGVDWPRLVAQATHGRVAPQLHLGLAYLRRSFSAPVPEHVVAALRKTATPLDVVRLQLSRGRAFVARSP
jgi:hypothetical protein